jgi:hypothetical protein
MPKFLSRRLDATSVVYLSDSTRYLQLRGTEDPFILSSKDTSVISKLLQCSLHVL